MRRHFFLSAFVPVAALTFYLLDWQDEISFQVQPKINGASLVNPHHRVSDSAFAEIVSVNARWVAVIPYAFSRQGEPEVYFNHERQWWGERVEGSATLISMAKAQGLSVMLKPHIWMRESWIGDFELDNEEKWKKWEDSYRAYILAFARVADSLDVELFCIGTEIKKTEVTRADYWRKLIREVRDIYKGKLTYAANWDHYEKVPFWDELDYIGVNAYFPLTQKDQKPTETIIGSAWGPIKGRLKSVALRYQKPVLFTEYGYASSGQSTVRPWEEDFESSSQDTELQALAYECLYRAFWKEDWMAGGFFWKWHLVRHSDRWERGHFSPQGKPSEQVIREWYETSGR